MGAPAACGCGAAYLDKPGAVIERLKDVVPSFSPVDHSVTTMRFDAVDEEVAR
jgi:hypothetical protein